MNTTNLFVELLVIGFGAAIWLALLLAAIFGLALPPAALSTEVLVLATPLVYLLGIVVDRAADRVFETLWEEDLLRAKTSGEPFVGDEDYFRRRRYVLNHSEALAKELQYDRSRLRICRGWALNAAVAAVALNVLVWVRWHGGALPWRLSIVGAVGFLGLAWACQRAWRSLASKQYDKIARQGKYLMERDGVWSEPSASEV